MAERLQIIWTPWRNHSELLRVRDWFFPNSASGEQHADADQRKKAFEQVGLTSHASIHKNSQLMDHLPGISMEAPRKPPPRRGINLAPHRSGLDRRKAGRADTGFRHQGVLHHRDISVRPAPLFESLVTSIHTNVRITRIITTIKRFVTGLLDAQQESKYKVSMYTQAQKIGLPALFVDIRHEATHGDMPNLPNLRSAADRALGWLWDDYWKGLEGEAVSITRDGQTLRTQERGAHLVGKSDGDEEEEEQPGGWQKWQGRWTPKPIGTI